MKYIKYIREVVEQNKIKEDISISSLGLYVVMLLIMMVLLSDDDDAAAASRK